MGARTVFRVKVERNSTAQVERELIRRVEGQAGRPLGSWEVSVVMLAPAEKSRPPMHVVALPNDADPPANRRFLLVTQPGALTSIISSDEELPNLLSKVSRYAQKSVRSVRGRAFTLGDFRVRVGIMFDKNAAAGVCVDIEYLPVSSTSMCVDLAVDMMKRICAPLMAPIDKASDAAVKAVAALEFQYGLVVCDMRKHLPPEQIDDFSETHIALLYRALLA